jgi:CDP-6-deoxy-D-xylo-4-hexulose-3-dehydrase
MNQEIFHLINSFQMNESSIIPGTNYIPTSGKVIDKDDIKTIIESVFDMNFTAGRFAKLFEKEFALFMEQRFCLLTNSGSSANLLAFSALMSDELRDRKITSGSEVITVAAGFPTTVNPIFQNNCIPVFVDIDPKTYQIDLNAIERAISPKTRAIMIAHTLGNPFNAIEVKKICEKYNLWLIEDCCDAVGSKLNGQMVGTFGDICTASFYPAHHITMGEGGAVLTNSPQLKKIIESLRDWGRDCWCPPGKDNTCGKRFSQKFEDLPEGYDHKYIYTHIGYNLKVTDMQAALGWSQLKKLPLFILKRKQNFKYLKSRLIHLNDYLDLPTETENSDPSWFGFPIRIKPECKKSRKEIILHLESHKIGTRLLFAGNLTRQPLYKNHQYRVVGSLKNSDDIMENLFWIGIYPALSESHFDYISEKLTLFLKGQK